MTYGESETIQVGWGDRAAGGEATFDYGTTEADVPDSRRILQRRPARTILNMQSKGPMAMMVTGISTGRIS